MNQQIATNSFTTGLDKDADKSLVKPTSYLHAENFRLFTDEGSTSGALTNIKGNIDFTENHIPSNQTIIGHASIRKDLYVFTKGTETIITAGTIIGFYPGPSATTRVYNTAPLGALANGNTVTITSVSGYYDGLYTVFDVGVEGANWFNISKYYNGTDAGSTWQHITFDDRLYRFSIDDTQEPPVVSNVKNIFARNDLGFSTSDPIQAVGRYETENIQKLYWSDGVFPMRVLNVADYLPDGTENNAAYINSLAIDTFEITPNVALDNIKLLNIIGGTLKAGVIQYSYQLFLRNGQETTFSPASQLIHLTDSNDFRAPDNRTYAGSPQFVDDNEENGRVNTGKGLELQIENIDTRYNRIRVVSIYYSEYYATPEIKIIYEGEFTGDALIFIDTGSLSIGTYTPEELASIGSLSLTPKTLETKDNRLFIGNIKEDFFYIPDEDFDARAYRFKPDTNGFVHNSDGTGPLVIDKNEPYWGIPFDHDAFNTYNDLDNDAARFAGDQTNNYKFQSNGTVGGEGPNVKYDFRQDILYIDEEPNTLQNNFATKLFNGGTTFGHSSSSYVLKSYNDYSSPFRSYIQRSFQRDEIYRFAIVFFDKKMRPSPAKWIADIRMPSIKDYPLVITNTALNQTYAMTVYPAFTVTIPDNVKDKISGYQIVRCKREAEDRTIMCQGIGTSPHKYNNSADTYAGTLVNWDSTRSNIMARTHYHSGAVTGLTIKKDIIQLISPETNFFGTLSLVPNDFLRLEGMYLLRHSSRDDSTVGSPLSRIKMGWASGTSAAPFNIQDRNITDHHIFRTTQYSADNFIDLKGIKYLHYALEGDTASRKGHLGTSLVLGIENEFTPGDSLLGTVTEYLLFNYRRKATQYRGSSYFARSTNSYIPCSPFINKNLSGLITAKAGDTFISMFDHQRVMLDPVQATNKRQVQVIMFPVETSINLNLRHDKHYNKLGVSDINRWFLQETKELGQIYADQYSGYRYPLDFTSLYLYNSVYSRDSDAKTYFAQPIDLAVVTEFDTRVYNSEKKINGEASDSWSKLLPNDFIDLDSTYGAITHLINYKDRLLAFQPDGIAILSVNYQSVIQDSDMTSLVLGTGGVLDRADYVSTTTGSKHNTSILSTPIGLYWFDASNKKVYRMGEMDEPISDIKGLNSYFQENIYGRILDENSYTDLSGAHVGAAYDDKFMEIMYTFKENGGGDNQFTVSYNVKADAYISFYSYLPQLYIEHKKKLFSTIDLNKLWLHNYGPYCSFYGSVFPSTLELIVNDNYYHTKTFDVVSFVSESSTDISNIYNDTFDTARCFNNYQNTDWFTLTYSDNIERRERTWSFHVPRNVMNVPIEVNPNIFDNANFDSTRLFKPRLRDKYMILDLIYNNADNYKLTIPGIMTKYRISHR